MKKATVKVALSQKEERPIATLVSVASQFSSSVHIESGTKYINAKSIMGMMALSLVNGDEITVVVDGADENEAIDGMVSFLEGGDK